MAPEMYSLIAVFVAAVAFVVYRSLIGAHEYRKFHGTMLVNCPENQHIVAVDVASARAALTAMFGKECVELNQCTRWPEKEDCDQACLRDIQAAPEQHSVWGIATRWYEGRTCVYCHRTIAPLSHLDHPPALISFDGKIVEWKGVQPERLPDTLSAAQPVCWNCSVIEGFRREHPELVTDRCREH